MANITESSRRTLLLLAESALQSFARNGFGLTVAPLIAAVARGEPYPELEQAYRELLAAERAKRRRGQRAA